MTNIGCGLPINLGFTGGRMARAQLIVVGYDGQDTGRQADPITRRHKIYGCGVFAIADDDHLSRFGEKLGSVDQGHIVIGVRRRLAGEGGDLSLDGR